MNKIKWAAVVLFIMFLLGAGYLASNIPMQELGITAVTQAEEYDITGTADLWYLKPLDAGRSYVAEIRFIAVEDRSEDLFTSHGNGQLVYMGCSELVGRCRFISVGRFLHVKLNMSAVQTELKLEDGTPFDSTRYSLKPVLTIEE